MDKKKECRHYHIVILPPLEYGNGDENIRVKCGDCGSNLGISPSPALPQSDVTPDKD